MSDNKSLKNKFLLKHYNKLFTDIMRYVFLLAFSYILLYPMLYIIVNSLKNPADYFNPTIQWVLRRVTFVNIKMAFLSMDYLNALKSTAINGIITALIQVAACSVAAYGLARFNFKGKTFLKASMILSILIPTAMVMIPTYINYKNLGILGTPLAFWLPSATCVGVNCGMYIYIYSQFFKSFPKEIEEAAFIDGAGSWKTFLKIVVPSSRVSFVTVIVFSLVWNWNDYYTPQMYLLDNYPLSVNLNNLTNHINEWLMTYGGDDGRLSIGLVLVSACLLSIMPLLIFYIIIQRKFIASVVTSGIVG